MSGIVQDPQANQPQPWLRTNRRALAIGLAAALLLAGAGIGGIVFAAQSPINSAWLWSSVLFTAICGYFSLSLMYQLTLPRLAYCDGYLLVYLTSSTPARVPIEIVELFFLGQGSSLVPQGDAGPTRTLTVVVRLAEAATTWHDRGVKPALGEWREGYIILRGTWCEPLSGPVVQQLNSRLAEIQRQRRLTQEASA
jgi:hypothetical protein